MDQVSKHIFMSILGLKQNSICILRVWYGIYETNQSHVTSFVISFKAPDRGTLLSYMTCGLSDVGQ